MKRKSLPPRGAWIEILGVWNFADDYTGRSPHGERGLKSFEEMVYGKVLRSLPPRGAWIEIGRTLTTLIR